MTAAVWVVLVLAGWALVATALAAVAAVALTRVRRRLVWDDTLPALEDLPAAEPADAEQVTA